jgi:hypothetical protein
MIHAVREYEKEPTLGLPEVLPAGETVLWRGAPHWWGVATRVCHIRAVAIYFGALMVWSIWASLSDGRTLGQSLGIAFRYLPLVGLIGIGLLALIAFWIARTTVYTITNRRVVLRFGLAIPMAVNLPFARIESASLSVGADGTGDIALSTPVGDNVSALFLWPHARPFQMLRPQPMLRGIADPRAVADCLAAALKSSVPSNAAVTSDVVRPTVERAARGAYATPSAA